MALEKTLATPLPQQQRRANQKRRFRPSRRFIRSTIAGIGLLLLWELVARVALPDYVGRPSGIIGAIPLVVVKGLPDQGLSSAPSFGSDLWATYAAIIEGTLLGTFVGAILGLAMGRVPQVRWFFGIYVQGLYAMPLIALVPLLTLWLGYGSMTRLVVVFVAVVLPVTVTTSDGTRATPTELLDVGKVFGARTRHIWFGISLPAAVPHIMAGMQLGISRAVTNSVAVEVLANVAGLGLSTFALSASFKENEAFVYVIALAIFAIALRSLIFKLRSKVAPWYVTTGT
jgi:ABC-type nitrate/sulfonate/bicarbonate transport system permease component